MGGHGGGCCYGREQEKVRIGSDSRPSRAMRLGPVSLERGRKQPQRRRGAGAGAGARAGAGGRSRGRRQERGRGRDRRDRGRGRSRRGAGAGAGGRGRRQERGRREAGAERGRQEGCVICLACGPLYDSASSPITTISSASPVPPRPPTSNCARPRCRHKENGGGISASSNTLARIRKQSRQAALQKSGRGGGAILLSWDESVPSVVNARRSEPRNMPPTREEGAPNDTPPRHPC